MIEEKDLFKPEEKRYRILMASDFFYPNVGGVENHIFQLSQCLIKRGHKVVVCTHQYKKRKGIRYMTNGLKVYYIPKQPTFRQTTLPTLLNSLPMFRNIMIRERIDIVHGHQATSCICHETITCAREMGIKTVFTDHSLFSFNEIGSFNLHKVSNYSLAEINHVICVSHTGKENTSLRAKIHPIKVSVIPNAIDASQFTPDPSKKTPGEITIVVMSRHTYRKGVDLLIQLIPIVCKKVPNAKFVIGGDGPNRVNIEEMREKYNLHDRIEMLGFVPHELVRNVLTRGDIFLNTSLTEAFCIAIVEAASCGLFVVSTAVGGVPEVLPSHMIKFAKPDAEQLAQAVIDSIGPSQEVDPWLFHSQVKNMYNWDDVAERTEAVYDKIQFDVQQPLVNRIHRYFNCGTWASKAFCFALALQFLFMLILEWLMPANEVDIAPDFPLKQFLKNKDKLNQSWTKSYKVIERANEK
ncbi:n-acetylglucosaminyl-phosphatidylinositol biosynthetic protein [Anaeramoeba ignava]|uniref:phosphatidylinositol N-acetylglucosaminyltransferase n=1 Tax=Anaeramoeba ignava TaxID=1746090 RepID=A0A9Q0LE00_ANAIG|nr:n-acetylglucosaminyl-phosphatidylinositol biosynthetic protein [Anaeramoeba ignava]|eukprot:Anaeramoba_ignava/a2816_24.p1 GENE.a2816_24~~a2816_24.p1  ORF type:complete len:466 (-),score=66.36 a2816_24:55-1452(-)